MSAGAAGVPPTTSRRQRARPRPAGPAAGAFSESAAPSLTSWIPTGHDNSAMTLLLNGVAALPHLGVIRAQGAD
ncbi:MAG: hypothetical protein EOO24_51825, partial [Comamonadaceae bacterium]